MVDTSSLFSNWIDGERNIRNIFTYANSLNKPCIVCFEEIDQFCNVDQHSDRARRIKTELLIQINNNNNNSKFNGFNLKSINIL